MLFRSPNSLLSRSSLSAEFRAPEMVVDLQQMASGCCHMLHAEAEWKKIAVFFVTLTPWGH